MRRIDLEPAAEPRQTGGKLALRMLDLLIRGKRREEAGKRRLELRFRVGLAARGEEERRAVGLALDAAEQARAVVEEP